MTPYPKFKLAAAHVAPVFHDTRTSLDKACSIIHAAARQGVQPPAFPVESIPGMPVWSNVGRPTHAEIDLSSIREPLAASCDDAPHSDVRGRDPRWQRVIDTSIADRGVK